MLNIQYGSKEFNLPYALTKSIGEVWLDAATFRNFHCNFLLMNILNTMHYCTYMYNPLFTIILYFTSLLSIIPVGDGQEILC